MISATVICQLVLISLICLTKSSYSRRHLPLVLEEPEYGRRNNRPTVSECQFGKTLRELGSTWYADLGPPFGVMYCIKCECVAVPKKRRVVTRVQCRNIKKECPPALCDDPIILPGKCCKTCPDMENTQNDTNIALDVPNVLNNDEDERSMKHFAALLTGRTSFVLKREEMKSMYATYNPHNIVATARFIFHRKNLYYSFYTSTKIGGPKSIQFIDDSNTIIEEHQLQTQLSGTLSAYQNVTGKVCGVWRRVPRDYKRLLREERLQVVLLWGNKHQSDLALAGKISKYTSLQTEMFSSLMEPTPSMKTDMLSGAGGTAIISVNNGAASSLHLTLLFNGIFNPEDYADVPINIKIEFLERKELIFEEQQKIRKVSSELNVIELSTPISKENLRLMSRGKLQVTVESRKNPNLRLQGFIVTRTTCEIFQTLLSPNTDSKTKSSGLAWVFLNRDGSLVFNIETDNVSSNDRPEINLIEEQGKRRNILEDLSSSFNFNQAIGIVEKVGLKILENLYAGDLTVNVGIESETSLIKGRLISRPVADARDSSEPILLKRASNYFNVALHAMGMAWISVDTECNLHYEITLNGLQNYNQAMQIILEEKPIEAIGAPISRKILEDFSGQYMEGFVLGMPANELVKLETSVCYMEIRGKDSNELLLRGKLKSTKVPAHCYPTYTDNNVPNELVPGDTMATITAIDAKCYHSGRFYNESEQWRNGQDICQICACQRGQAFCEPIKCPLLRCKTNEEQMQRDGECCATCLPQKISAGISTIPEQHKRGCSLGDQFHLAGATWHPYLPPNGFDTCTTCVCDILTLEIRCPRVVCPHLACSEKEAYRPDKKACCKVCPEAKRSEKTSPINVNILQDQGTKNNQRSADEKLNQGGCKVLNKIYENGQEWHPILASHGEQKCIKCRCKDAKVNCDRKRCTRSVCQQTRVSNKRKILEKISSLDTIVDECCLSQCRRSRRHHKRNHQSNKQIS